MIHHHPALSRRTLLGAAAALPAAGALASCTGGAEPAPDRSGGPVKLTVNTGLGLFQGREAYLYVAREKDFFAEEGIDEVEIVGGQGTKENLRQLAAGKVDIATIDVEAGMQYYGSAEFEGFEFVLTAVLHTRHLGCIMVLESSDIRSPRDLAGTVMGVIPGGTNPVLFPAYAELAGFDDETVEFQSPPAESFGAALGEGTLDAVQQFVVGQPNIELGAGEPVRVFTYARLMPELYGSALGCARALAESDPDLVRRFNRAALRGLEYAIGHPDEAGQIFEARDVEGQPAAVAQAENELLEPYTRLEDEQRGEFVLSKLAKSAGIMKALGVVAPGFDPRDIVAFDLFS